MDLERARVQRSVSVQLLLSLLSPILVDFSHTLTEGLLSLFRDDTTDGTGLLKVCERHRCDHPEER